MSTMLLAWLGGFAILILLGLKNPTWTMVLYFHTFFAFPGVWWWGGPVENVRWNLIAGFIVIIGVLIKKGSDTIAWGAKASLTSASSPIILLFLANATFVQYTLANDLEIGEPSYILLAKVVFLYFLMTNLITSNKDLKLISIAMVIGASYIGYEATINDRGNLVGSRLEGIGAPGATGANQLASLMVTIIPVAGSLFLISSTKVKVVLGLAVSFILNVILLCNSRGAFLAMIFSGLVYLILSPSKIRKQTILLLTLGVVATFVLLGDDRIVNRFMTTFADDQTRDQSADHRLLFWKAGLNVIQDYPLGTGGYGFKEVHAVRYIAEQGITVQSRSVHNGFINEACEWGIQGLFLKILFFLTAIVESRRAAAHQLKLGNIEASTLHLGYISGLSAFMISCIFGDFLDAEWGYWYAAMLVCFSRVYGPGGNYETEIENSIPQELVKEGSHVSAVERTR